MTDQQVTDLRIMQSSMLPSRRRPALSFGTGLARRTRPLRATPMAATTTPGAPPAPPVPAGNQPPGGAARAAKAPHRLPSSLSATTAPPAASGRATRPLVTTARAPMLVTARMPLLLLLMCVLQGPRATLAAAPRDLSNYQSRHACPVGPATAPPNVLPVFAVVCAPDRGDRPSV